MTFDESYLESIKNLAKDTVEMRYEVKELCRHGDYRNDSEVMVIELVMYPNAQKSQEQLEAKNAQMKATIAELERKLKQSEKREIALGEAATKANERVTELQGQIWSKPRHWWSGKD